MNVRYELRMTICVANYICAFQTFQADISDALSFVDSTIPLRGIVPELKIRRVLSDY
jgi:hypothetical protein